MSLGDSEFSSLKEELLHRFVVELLELTWKYPKQRELQKAMEAYLDHLSRWLKPSDLTQPPRPMFTLIDDLGFNKEQEDVMGKLTPEGEAFFRAWQRSQGFDPDLVDIDYKITKGTPQAG